MPFVIPPAPDATTELKLGAVNIRRASGRERDAQGNLIPQGRILVVFVLRRYTEGVEVDGQDFEPVITEDADGANGWLAQLVANNDPLAAEAIQKFAAVDEYMKWIAALRGSQSGICDRPESTL